MRDILAKPLVPVATQADADATIAGLIPLLPDDATVVVCHVIEKAGGAPDKASVQQREDQAAAIFERVFDACADADVTVQTRIDYGTDVAETVFAAAADVDATSVAFTPRQGSRWIRLLTGDTALSLVTSNDRPVVVLPDDARTDADHVDADATRGDDADAGTVSETDGDAGEER